MKSAVSPGFSSTSFRSNVVPSSVAAEAPSGRRPPRRRRRRRGRGSSLESISLTPETGASSDSSSVSAAGNADVSTTLSVGTSRTSESSSSGQTNSSSTGLDVAVRGRLAADRGKTLSAASVLCATSFSGPRLVCVAGREVSSKMPEPKSPKLSAATGVGWGARGVLTTAGRGSSRRFSSRGRSPRLADRGRSGGPSAGRLRGGALVAERSSGRGRVSARGRSSRVRDSSRGRSAGRGRSSVRGARSVLAWSSRGLSVRRLRSSRPREEVGLPPRSRPNRDPVPSARGASVTGISSHSQFSSMSQ